MKSMETLLSESLGAMNEGQKAKFFDRRIKGSPIEAQVALAETVLKESSGRSKITRNNGGSRQLSEAERNQGAMQEADRVLFEGIEACRETSKGISDFVDVGRGEYVRITEGQDQLSDDERRDMQFCRGIGLSEADALKVVKSKGGIRG